MTWWHLGPTPAPPVACSCSSLVMRLLWYLLFLNFYELPDYVTFLLFMNFVNRILICVLSLKIESVRHVGFASVWYSTAWSRRTLSICVWWAFGSVLDFLQYQKEKMLLRVFFHISLCRCAHFRFIPRSGIAGTQFHEWSTWQVKLPNPFSKCLPVHTPSSSLQEVLLIHSLTNMWGLKSCRSLANGMCLSLLLTRTLLITTVSLFSSFPLLWKAYSHILPVFLLGWSFTYWFRALHIFVKVVIYNYIYLLPVCSFYFTFFFRADEFKFLIFIVRFVYF